MSATRSYAKFHSFTGSESLRYPGPDVARGFMLLLIAVANVPLWTTLFSTSDDGGMADRYWVFLRQILVDHRAYPLFALLFGFGLMTMIRRRQDAHLTARIHELDTLAPGLTPEMRKSWIEGVEGEARESARALVRRRGLWMLLFGGLHAVFFVGDIIGTYALVAVMCAGLIAARRWRLMIAIGAIQQILAVALFLFAEFAAMSFSQSGVHSASNLNEVMDSGAIIWFFYPIFNFLTWIPSTLATVFLSQVLPAVFIGAALAMTELVSSPQRYRGLLLATGIGGLTLGALMGTPAALAEAGFLDAVPAGMGTLHEFSGILGAIGWCALLIVLAGPPREKLAAPLSFLSAVGKRSLSAYLFQTFFFLAVFVSLAFSGVEGVAPLPALGIAVGVWTVIAVACWVMEQRGLRGPFEVLLRAAVASSSRQLLPQIPLVSVMPSSACAVDSSLDSSAPELSPSFPSSVSSGDLSCEGAAQTHCDAPSISTALYSGDEKEEEV